MKIANWRGNPNATVKDFEKLLKIIKPKKSDVFYDLGCGHGEICLKMAKFVKCSIGIENHREIYNVAIAKSLSSNYCNVKIIKNNFEEIPLNEATIIYCTMDLSFRFLAKIQKQIKKGILIVPEIPLPYPIKSKYHWPFYVAKLPFERVKDINEYAENCMGWKNAKIDEVFDWLTKEKLYDDLKSLRWQIPRSDYLWNKINDDL